jgi:rhodanese-related sulfurtransferase
MEATSSRDMATVPAKAHREEAVTPPDIGPNSTMAEVLRAYPGAKIALFIRYHIGGCASCSYQLSDTLAEACRNYSFAFIRQSANVEAKIHVSPEQVVGGIARGEDMRLLDARSAEEWQADRIPGAQPVTVELTFEALDSWPKRTPIVFYSNEGRRSLDKAAYFQAYGFTNARSLDGGIHAWPGKIESTLAGRPVR